MKQIIDFIKDIDDLDILKILIEQGKNSKCHIII